MWRNTLKYVANAEEKLDFYQAPEEVLELFEALKLSGKALEQDALHIQLSALLPRIETDNTLGLIWMLFG